MNQTDAEHRRTVRSFVSSQLRMRKSPQQIEEALIARGVESNEARRLIHSALEDQQQTHETATHGGQTAMVAGGILFAIGAGVTFFTYQMATENPEGGHYVIAYGAIIGGAAMFFRGLAQRMGTRR